MTNKPVNITKEQKDWIDENNVNLSSFLRAQIEEEMK